MLGDVEILCIFKQTFNMCQNCCDSGYSDYPAFLKTVAAHRIDYIDGFKKRQYELYDEQDTENTEFCRFCFDSGVLHASIGIWAPPLTPKLGHYTSYEQGYYGESATASDSVAAARSDEGIQVGEHVAAPASGPQGGSGFFQAHKRTITIAAVSVAVVSAVSVSAIRMSKSGYTISKLFHHAEQDTSSETSPTPAASAEPTVPNDTATHKDSKKSETAHKLDVAKEKTSVTISSMPAHHTPAAEPHKTAAAVATPKKAPAKVAVAHKGGHHRHHRSAAHLKHTVAKKKTIKKPTPSDDEEDTPVAKTPAPIKKAASTAAATAPIKRAPAVAAVPPAKTVPTKKPAAPAGVEADDSEDTPKPSKTAASAPKPKPAVAPPAPKPAPAKPVAAVKPAPEPSKTRSAVQPMATISVDATPTRPIDPVVTHMLDSTLNAGAIPKPQEGRTFSFHVIDRYHHETSDAPPAAAATVIQFGRFPKASDSLLTEADLFRMKKEDMIIMLNEVYARHHFKFKDVRLNDYFSQQEWYKAEYDDVSARLTDIEQKNITFIKKHLLP